MNDTKHESTQTGWTTPENNSVAGWDAAKVDQSTVERIEAYEQKFRDERAAKRAEREARAEEVIYVSEVDVTDPSRVYTPLDRQRPAQQEREESSPELGGGGDAANIEDAQAEQAEQSEIEAAEIAELEDVAQGAEIEVAEPVAEPAIGWEVSQPLLNAAEMDAEILQRKAIAEIDPVRAAARAEVERAFSGHDQGHEIER